MNRIFAFLLIAVDALGADSTRNGVALTAGGTVNGVTVSAISGMTLSSAYDADALDYFNRVEAAESTSPTFTAQKTGINAWFLAAKGTGPNHAVNYFADIKRLNFFGGATITGAAIPAIKTLGDTADTLVNSGSFTFTPTGGLTGNDSTTYIDTGLVADSLTANNTHQAFFNLGATGDTGSHGAFNGALDRMLMYPPYIIDLAFDDEYNSTTGRLQASSAVLPPYGHMIGTRRASNDQEMYKDGVSIGTATGAGGTIPNYKLFVFARNNVGTADDFRGDQLGSYQYGNGLTAAKVAVVSSDLTILMTALGRLSNNTNSFLQLPAATPGDNITATILNTGTKGTALTWGYTPAGTPLLKVAANFATRTTDVIALGTTYSAASSTADLAISFNHDGNLESATTGFPVATGVYCVAGFFKPGPAGGGSDIFDPYVLQSLVGGKFAAAQFNNGNALSGGTYGMYVESKIGGSTVKTGPAITISQGTTYWVCLYANFNTGIVKLAVYQGGSIIGTIETTVDTDAGSAGVFNIGNNTGGVSAGTLSYFQSTRMLWNNISFPIAP